MRNLHFPMVQKNDIKMRNQAIQTPSPFAQKSNIHRSSFIIHLFLVGLCFCFFSCAPVTAQKATKTTASAKVKYDESLYDAVKWRNLGPHRGGRSAAVAGVAGKPNLYYMGAAGGGVWKTEDGGQTWNNISDGFFGGSIGAVTVSEYDPNVIYVGGGEVTVRGNMSYGYGMWKSVDAGKTWTSIGLDKTYHIPRIRVHPKNPDLVYAAALGNVFASSNERGIYRSKNGGDTWEKVLFVNKDAGGCDLILDPNNPRIIYASTWNINRTPYSLESGGPGSALWKSTDGGDNWTEISKNEGFPTGTLGIIGVTVSPVNSNKVFAQVEAEKGGLFMSSNAGKTWSLINDTRDLRQRAWYYSRIYADPQDEDVIYGLNVQFHKSKDGGKSFKTIRTPHGDHHDMWIAPEDPTRFVIADDGGAQVTFDGGTNFSTYMNQPTAQYYRVTTDDAFPYRIYVAQQDNSTQRIAHRSGGGSIGEDDWEVSAGCECGHIAIDPRNNEVVYGGCYDGFIGRLDHRNDQTRIINVYPDLPMGWGADGMKYRFQWNFPIFISPHDPNKLYTASNHLHLSTNEGQSWEVISPDLTRNDPAKQVSSGGPITQDNTSVEYYCTIFAAAESPRVEGLLWTGSDDGRVNISKDGGKNWTDVTPTGAPKWLMWNSIEPDPHSDGGAYLAGTLYKAGDFRPYLYKTKDYGQTWTKIINGIDNQHFTRVVRADPNKQGILYAGTETGMYISFDDGANFQPFQMNLPIVPITDLTIKNDNLIAATQGRSVWMIDDLTVIHQMSDAVAKADMHLFKPMDSYRMGGFQNPKPRNEGMNRRPGVLVNFNLKDTSLLKDVSLSFYEADGDLIRTYSTKAKEKADKLKVEKGSNQFAWNMTYPAAKKFDGMIMWWSSLSGPQAVPGDYKVTMKVGDKEQTQSFKILKDPRSEVSLADIQKQFDFIKGVGEKLTETHETIIDIRKVRDQLNNYKKLIGDDEDKKEIGELADEINEKMKKVEEALYQTKNRSRQDPLNFPVRLNNKLGHLNSLIQRGDYPPTDQMIEVRDAITEKIDTQLAEFESIKNTDLPKFNQLVKDKAVDAIVLKKKDAAM